MKRHPLVTAMLTEVAGAPERFADGKFDAIEHMVTIRTIAEDIASADDAAVAIFQLGIDAGWYLRLAATAAGMNPTAMLEQRVIQDLTDDDPTPE